MRTLRILTAGYHPDMLCYTSRYEGGDEYQHLSDFQS